MSETANITVNPIEKAIYKCVAINNGASGMHLDIINDLEESFGSKNIATRIVNGTTTLSQEDLKNIKSVLVKYDPTITIDDLI